MQTPQQPQFGGRLGKLSMLGGLLALLGGCTVPPGHISVTVSPDRCYDDCYVSRRPHFVPPPRVVPPPRLYPPPVVRRMPDSVPRWHRGPFNQRDSVIIQTPPFRHGNGCFRC